MDDIKKPDTKNLLKPVHVNKHFKVIKSDLINKIRSCTVPGLVDCRFVERKIKFTPHLLRITVCSLNELAAQIKTKIEENFPSNLANIDKKISDTITESVTNLCLYFDIDVNKILRNSDIDYHTRNISRIVSINFITQNVVDQKKDVIELSIKELEIFLRSIISKIYDKIDSQMRYINKEYANSSLKIKKQHLDNAVKELMNQYNNTIDMYKESIIKVYDTQRNSDVVKKHKEPENIISAI